MKKMALAINRSAPTALPAQCEGCGGAENEKAPINIEALNRCARLSALSAKDLPGVDAPMHRSRRSCLVPPWKHSEVRMRGLPVLFRTSHYRLSTSRPSRGLSWLQVNSRH